MSDKQKQLFKTKIVPGKRGSGKLFEEEFVQDDGPVECLGMTFENDEKRREYFLEKLREKLKAPEFRKIEGFPIGEDEDILALSDPPYYTACPNPFIDDFIKQYGKPYDPNVSYSREPFAADVSEGKNNLIYNAHSYHTKVPHKAIMRYILHYTEPGDIVFDGFCGTGMTGVAAQMCGDKTEVESIGFKVKPGGTILRQETDENGKSIWVEFSKLGPRRVILNDLSPAATFIAYNYNIPVDVTAFEYEAKRILAEVEEECGWMYETKHQDGRTGRINCTVWSDVFVCPECAAEVIFYEAAVNEESGRVNKEFLCPHCTTELTKRDLDHAWTYKFDNSLGKTIRQAKRVPVLINYSLGKQRFEKRPDDTDLLLLNKIDASTIPYEFPKNRLIDGKETRRNDPIGITHTHHFYMKRSLWILSALIHKTSKIEAQLVKSFCQFLMTVCFREAYRVLKPGRWMTVEFSNTKASVWNSIQTALTEAGFIVANVAALDKKQRVR